MKKEKLSQNEEWLRLMNRMQSLNAEEMVSKPTLKNTIPFDKAAAKYYDPDTGRVVSALKRSILTAVPKTIRDADGEVIYEGYKYELHHPLKYADFNDPVLYYQYRSMRANQVAEFFKRRSRWWERKTEVAKEIEEFLSKRKTKRYIANYESLKKDLKDLERTMNNDQRK